MNRFNFTGQTRIINELDAIVENTIRSKQFGGTYLFSGSPGIGKTRLAKIFCELLAGINYSYQHPDENQGMINLRGGAIYSEVILIDEVHRAKNQEILYPLIDAGGILVVMCTTHTQLLTDALISRCTAIFVLDEYTDEEITQIILESSKIFGVPYTRDSARMIADRCRQNPRKAVNLVHRLSTLFSTRRYPVTLTGIGNAMNSLGIYNEGYTVDDLSYIDALEKLGGQASLNTISRILPIDNGTITNMIEPFLIRKGKLTINARGRQLT